MYSVEADINMFTLTCQLDNNWEQRNDCSVCRGDIWEQIYLIRLLLNYTTLN